MRFIIPCFNSVLYPVLGKHQVPLGQLISSSTVKPDYIMGWHLFWDYASSPKPSHQMHRHIHRIVLNIGEDLAWQVREEHDGPTLLPAASAIRAALPQPLKVTSLAIHLHSQVFAALRVPLLCADKSGISVVFDCAHPSRAQHNEACYCTSFRWWESRPFYKRSPSNVVAMAAVLLDCGSPQLHGRV